ncbi:MAG TPA: DUF2721 domain-containing protein [Roseimicrobium sp.]|nr:DUF2721 domain-containing protein [Roseimicrobium sp.]
MDAVSLGQSPFAVLTFIAAPAVLTNAASVLAMSTINRMLRTRDRMQQLFNQSAAGVKSPAEAKRLIEQVNRVERQASCLLQALHSIYVALGAFAAASLVTLLGAVLEHWQGIGWLNILVGCALVLGFLGVGGMVRGCWNLLLATQLSLKNIQDEAGLIREQQEKVRETLSQSLSDSA